MFSNAENLRAGGSCNRGVKEAAGEYILFIDADDYFRPGAVPEGLMRAASVLSIINMKRGIKIML